MSVLIGVGIVTTITTIYLGKKGWQALHKAVGITPGVLTYQDDQAPLSLSAVTWRHLRLHKKYLQRLPNDQLRQLQRIDDKVSRYQSYQKTQQADDKTPTVTESQFVLQKLLYTRLPDTLASYDYLVSIDSADLSQTEKKVEASELLQQVLDHIEQRLDALLDQAQTQHLQALRVMKNYVESHDR
ncbi:hypothetical protein R0I52_00665 [Psychrobacter sp. CAM01]|uniref:hypothetical protein n=1 Tax=Psychrobacter sp. CAM01 TaxID=3080335 RepID=UPI002935F4B2|nr:hypothetical protein [Psychrobacter sp. CAM01]MDV2859223.1 hypothetical protein [Psychrobacter sp. CAM01]